MSVESNFDTQAKSEHCVGIMQVDERYASQWIADSRHLINHYNITDVSNLYDFKLNVILGCKAYEEWAKIISDKDMDLTIDTLGAYNNGYNYIAQPDYEYAANVLAFATTLQQGYKVTQPEENTQLQKEQEARCMTQMTSYEMRSKILQVYRTNSWRTKVAAMSEAQVVAVYISLKNRKKV